MIATRWCICSAYWTESSTLDFVTSHPLAEKVRVAPCSGYYWQYKAKVRDTLAWKTTTLYQLSPIQPCWESQNKAIGLLQKSISTFHHFLFLCLGQSLLNTASDWQTLTTWAHESISHIWRNTSTGEVITPTKLLTHGILITRHAGYTCTVLCR